MPAFRGASPCRVPRSLPPLPLRVHAVGLLLTLGLAACAGPQVVQKSQTPLEHALELRDQGRLPEAEGELRALATAGDPAAVLPLAETLMLRGRHAEAAELLRPKLQANPEDAEVAALLARALDGAGVPDEAIAAYARRLMLVPGDADAAVRMAELLMSRGDHAHASQIAQAALKTHPDHPLLLVQLARAMLGRGRIPQALEAAHKATQIAPHSSEAWLRLGEVLVAAGELEAAETALGRCLALDPQHPEALREMGAVLVERGEPQKALATLKKALQISPESAPTWVTLAVAKQRAKDLTGAVAALEQALRIAPKSAQIHRYLAEVSLEDGQPGRALDEAEAARHLQQGKAAAQESGEVEELIVRAIVVQALADEMCHKTREGAELDARVQKQLQAHGVPRTTEVVAQVGVSATASVKAAAARCGRK